MNRVLGVAATAIWAATATGGWAGGPGAGDPGAVAPATPAASGAQQMASTSEPDLRRQVTIAGQPRAVLCAAERLGPANPDAFPPPGPSDHVLRAVLDYGSADAVAVLVGGGPTEALRIDAPAWFPAALSPGQPLDVIRHHGTQGFMDADVMTVPAAPGLILLERQSS